jgi:hypothetical protein
MDKQTWLFVNTCALSQVTNKATTIQIFLKINLFNDLRITYVKQVELLPRARSNAFPRCPATHGAAAITI